MALSDAAPFAVAAWTLDEASGTRADQVGSNSLTDNNTVGVGTGKFGNCADFERNNSEHLSIADNAALSMGDVDFTIRCWINLESLPPNFFVYNILAKANAGFVEEYQLRVGDNDIVSATFDNFGVQVNASNFGVLSVGTWYLIHLWHDSVNNQVGISVNAGTPNTASYSAGVADGDGSFHIGSFRTSNFFDGLIDDVVILKGYVLSSAERTEDYNSGAGVAFADWAAGSAELTGSASFGFTNSGSLKGTGELTGALTTSFSNSAVLDGTGALDGTIAVAFSNSGVMVGAGDLSGTSALAFTNTSTLDGAGALAGNTTVTFSNSGTISGEADEELTGTSSLAFSNSGTLTGAGDLSGTSDLTFTASGTTDGVGSLAGSTSITFSVSGVLLIENDLTGSCSVSFTNSATLDGAGDLSGSSSATFSVTSTLDGAGSLTGTTSLTFSVTATLSGNLVFGPAGWVKAEVYSPGFQLAMLEE